MSSITKKIIASVTMVACAAWMVPGSAQALTAAELQTQIDALLAQLATLQSQLTTLEGGSGTTGGTTPSACVGVTFTRALKVGDSGTDVKCMQAVLNLSADTQVAASGVGSAGNETTYFGPLTKTAVIKFQEKYASSILSPWNLTSGTGYVGSTTRAKLTELMGSGTTDSGDEDEGDEGGTEEPSAAGENKVQLATDTPAAKTVAKGAQDVIFSKVNFCAASAANTVSKITVTRGGIAADTDLSYVKLYEGATQVGATQAINSTTHKAVFSSLNWTIPANSCKVLTIKGSIASAATAGNSPKLNITSASDIVSTVALDGVFPIESTAKTIAGISTGAIYVTGQTSPSGDVVAGGTEQAVAGFQLYATGTEALYVHSVTVTEVGSSVDTDLSNIKLYYGSTQLNSTVASLTKGKATIDFSSNPLEILAGNSKNVKVYADIGTSTGVDDRTVRFEITANTDVTAYGANSGGSVLAYGTTDQGADTWPQQGSEITVVLGTLTVAKDTNYSPSAQDYARGTTGNDIIAFKFTAGANEGVRVTQIKLQETVASTSDSDVVNITLYDAETGEIIAGPSAQVSGYVTFGSYTTGLDASGLFDVAKNESKVVLVRADISSSANVGNEQIGYQITTPTTYIKADGLESANDLGTSEINGGVTSAVPSTAVNHDVIEYGTLTVGPSSDTPAASTYALGTENITFAKFDLTVTGENMLVTQFNVLFATDTTDGATTTAADSADITNVELYDGSTLLGTDVSISSGYAEFAVNLTVTKNTTKTLTIVGDVPTGSDADGLQAWIEKPGDVTAQGADSGVAITPTASSWSSVNGNVFTMGAPGLVVQAATLPATQTFVKNTSGVKVATMYFTASSTEDLKITKIRIAGDATTATDTAGYATSSWSEADYAETGLVVKDMVGNVKIYDGSSQIGTTDAVMTDGTNYDYAEFTGLSLTIPKGTTKAIDVVLDVNDSTTSSATPVMFYFGVATNTTDIAGSGLQSGTALAATTITIGENGEAGQPMVFGASGTLTVQADPNEAISAIQMAGASEVNVASWKLTGSNEAIKISKIKFDANHSSAATGTSVGYNVDSDGDITTALQALATTSDTEMIEQYCFEYSLNDGATSTCYFPTGLDVVTDTTDDFIAKFNASSTCATATAGIWAESATTTYGALQFYASPAGQYALEIRDCGGALKNASSVADELKLGLKYGGTETVGTYAGANANVSAVHLYLDSVKKGTSYIGTQETDKVIFEWSTGDEMQIPDGNAIITLKIDLSSYIALTEGSTLTFTLGDGTNGNDTTYITAKGASSDVTIENDAINSSSAIGALASETMYLYSTKPTVSSPYTTTAILGSNAEVFKFNVDNANSGLDLNINAIRFTINTGAATDSIWGKTFNLYKASDLSTIIGTGVAESDASTTDTTGWVTIYPTSGSVVGTGGSTTYVLKGDTSSMNITTGYDTLIVSIESDDFYWDDGLAVNANKKVSGLPLQGNTLSY